MSARKAVEVADTAMLAEQVVDKTAQVEPVAAGILHPAWRHVTADSQVPVDRMAYRHTGCILRGYIVQVAHCLVVRRASQLLHSVADKDLRCNPCLVYHIAAIV